MLLDEHLDSKTKQVGDTIIAELQEYVQLQGSCPSDITDVELYKNGLPDTYFRDSEFQYQHSTDAVCRLGYAAPAAFWCSKSTNPEYDKWVCDD